MIHLEEGALVAVRDGSLVPGETSEHLRGCPRCQAALGEADRRGDLIAASLGSMDETFDVEAAKRRVRVRLDAAPERRIRGRRSAHLGRAAALLLVAAGAAYALPGSPLRSWLSATDDPEAAVSGAEGPTQEIAHEGGIVVAVPEGRIRVVLSNVGAGSTLDVVWRDAATARITAPAGSSFSFAEGRAEARVAPGPVRVELPRLAPTVSVEVDGRIYLRRSSAEGLEVLEPVTERSDDRIRFVVRD